MSKISDVLIYQIPLSRSDKLTLKNKNCNLPSTNSKNEFSAGLYFCSLILQKDFSSVVREYIFNLNGKPFLMSGEFGFNISYTDNDVYIAIAKGSEIGIDVEEVNDINLNVSQEFMSKRELRKLKGVQNKYEYFYKIWTLKEAYLKLVGSGINNTITNIEFKEDEDDGFSLHTDPVHRTYFNSLTLKKCIISIAASSKINYEIFNFKNTKEFLKKYEN